MEPDQVPGYTISIHALLAESDERAEQHANSQQEFLSTLSLRRATSKKSPPMCFIRHFYPRSPCGERPVPSGGHISKTNFYPRSPCGERHHRFRRWPIPRNNFYPRSPCGERPSTQQEKNNGHEFLSTLSLRRATH